jgi:hypothetical protein
MSFINFCIEEINKDQSRKGNRNQKLFSSNDAQKLQDIKKSKILKRIFAYINILLKVFPGKYFHIHINVDLSENISDNLVTLFSWNTLINSEFDKNILNTELKKLNLETKKDIIIPFDNNARTKNQKFKERYGLNHKLKFLTTIKNTNNHHPSGGLLLNINAGSTNCVNLSEFSSFPESIDSYINFGSSLQDIYENNDNILKNISTIINLFPAERGRNIWYHDFLAENINNWNQFPEFNFKKVITITSGYKTPEALLEMQKQNKFQTEETYTLFSFEL